MKNKSNKRKRAGLPAPRQAGKPAFFGSPMKRRNVMLDDETVKALKKLGGGNLSEGIRQAAKLII